MNKGFKWSWNQVTLYSSLYVFYPDTVAAMYFRHH